MSIALFAVRGVLAPWQGLWRWFKPAATTQVRPTLSGMGWRGRAIATHSIATSERCIKVAHQTQSKTMGRRPLRVVRILEANQAPSNVGRMLISGRMADVCAELDRLAAREATLH